MCKWETLTLSTDNRLWQTKNLIEKGMWQRSDALPMLLPPLVVAFDNDNDAADRWPAAIDNRRQRSQEN